MNNFTGIEPESLFQAFINADNCSIEINDLNFFNGSLENSNLLKIINSKTIFKNLIFYEIKSNSSIIYIDSSEKCLIVNSHFEVIFCFKYIF